MTADIKRDTAVILLSGGLDSAVSLAKANETFQIELALVFDYGQKAFKKELGAAKKIAKYYGIKLECIKLDWLKNITKTALVSDMEVPVVKEGSLASRNKVWVPNRNGLFINIAAAYADSFGYDYIVIGANKEEAGTFLDNSEKFINNINKSLELSADKNVKVLAPLIHLDKNEIVKLGLELNAPLRYINSCYNKDKNHCGRCESCSRLKKGLEVNGQKELIKDLFG